MREPNATLFCKMLKKTIPIIFGDNAENNSFKSVLDYYVNNNSYSFTPVRKSNRTQFHIEGKSLLKLGFPSQRLILYLNQYAPQAWSFSAVSEVKKSLYFSLEWNTNLSRFIPEKKPPYIASAVKITLRTHKPDYFAVKRQFTINADSSAYCSDLIHRELVYKINAPSKSVPAFKISLIKKHSFLIIKSTLIPLTQKSSAQSIRLKIPIKIAFYC